MGTRKKKKKPIVLIAVVIILVALVLDKEQKNNDIPETVVLMSPKKFGNSMLESDVQNKYKLALKLFQAGTYSNYIKAQNELIEVAEGVSNNSSILALLCLTHRELWPYSKQDNQDMEAMSKVVRRVAKIEAIGTNNDTCRVVANLVLEQYEKARIIIDKVLLNNPKEAVFYEFKSEIYAQNENYSTAISYLNQASSIWKNWSKPHIKAIVYNLKISDNSKAMDSLNMLLKTYPNHNEVLVLNSVLNPGGVNKILEIRSKTKLPKYVDSLAMYRLSEFYEKNGNKDQALKYITESFKLDPLNEKVSLLLSRLSRRPVPETQVVAMLKADKLYKDGDYLGAQSGYKLIYERYKNAKAALKAGKTLWKMNQAQSSLDWIRKALSEDPNMLDAYIVLADYLSQRYYFDKATGILQQALNLKLRPNEVYRTQALVALRSQDFKMAETLSNRAIKIYDSDVEAHIVLSRALYNMSRYQDAYQTAAKAIELGGQNIDAQILYSKILSKFQSQSVGVEYIQNLINTYPSNMKYRIALAEIYMDNQNYIEAQGVLAQVTQFDLKNKQAFLLVGKLQEDMNQFNNSLKSYLKAASIDPTDVGPLFNIGVLYFKNKKYQDAINQFKRVTAINNRYPLANFYIGKSYLQLGNPTEALVFAKNEMNINPNLVNPYLLAGEANMKASNYNQAQIELQKAINISPQGVGVYILLARAYRLADNLEIAEKMILKAQQLENGNPDIYKEQGVIYETRGRVDQAITAYDRYIKLAPNRNDVGVIKAKIESLSRAM